MGLKKNLLTGFLVAAVTFACIYFLYLAYPGIHPLSKTNFVISNDEIVQLAQHYLPMDAAEKEMETTAEFLIKKEYSYYQREFEENYNQLEELQTFKFWQVTFSPPDAENVKVNIGSDNGSSTEKNPDQLYRVKLSTSGILLGFDFTGPIINDLKQDTTNRPDENRSRSTDRPRQRVRAIALDFLVDIVRDTSALVAEQRDLESVSGIPTINFIFKENLQDFPIFYDIQVAGSRVLKFERSLFKEEFEPKLSSYEKFSQTSFTIFEVIVILFLAVFMLYYLFRLYREEAISFKMALPIAFLVILFQIIISLTQLRGIPIWLTMVGITALALLMGVVILTLFAISDAFARQMWSSKLQVTDLFLRFKFIRSINGIAVLRGSFLGLISLTSFVLGISIYQYFFNGQIYLEESLTFKTTALFPTMVLLAQLSNGALFHEYFYRLFGLTLLKKWFQNRNWLVLTGSLIGVFFASDFEILNFPVNVLVLLIPAFLFTYFFIRFEIFTNIFGYFTFTLLSKAIIFSQTNETYFRSLGVGLFLILAVILLTALLAIVVKRDESDVDVVFVPDYIEKKTEKSRLLRELDLARTIQKQFLPKNTPVLDGFQISASCQPAWEVGGDYYDFFKLRDDKMGIVIGDVSNKGISAAFFMTLVKGFLKALSDHYDRPVDILRKANHLFYENVERGHFISMIYGVLDKDKNTFTFARAGHNPLLFVVGKTNSAQLKTPPGIGIGIVRDDKFSPNIQEESVKLEQDDLIVLYTDGYSEAMNDKLEQFGEERLQSFIQQNRTNLPEKIISELDKKIEGWEGKNRSMDDKTIVILKKN